MHICRAHDVQLHTISQFSQHYQFFHYGESILCPVCETVSDNDHKKLMSHVRAHNQLELCRVFTSNVNYPALDDLTDETSINNYVTGPNSPPPDISFDAYDDDYEHSEVEPNHVSLDNISSNPTTMAKFY